MTKLADAETIRAVDAAAMKRYGITGLQLMENAGRNLACSIKRFLDERERPWGARVTIVAGGGNNGGDGYVAARHLRNSGVEVRVISLVRPNALKGDAAVNATAWRKMGGVVHTVLSEKDLVEHEPAFRHSSVVVDAIFGTGLSSPVKGLFAKVIELVNSSGRPVIAVDIPSGIDATTGAVLGVAVRADLTVTMAMEKLGLYLYPGRAHAGRVEVVDIGAPRALVTDEEIRWNLITEDILTGFLKKRRADTHKGSFGHLFVVGGSTGKTGAVCMAAASAMRTGAGLTTIGAARSLNAILEAKTTEVMTASLPETPDSTLGAGSVKDALSLAEGKDAVVLGPGLGYTPDTASFVEGFLKGVNLPVILDADGLNSLGKRLDIIKKVRSPKVLTPHPGEMSRLLGITTEEVRKDRIGAAERLARKASSVVVLKGASTIVAAPTGEVFVNPTGNAGLASAGTGDVLSGMIGALLAQGYTALQSALAGVYLHGLAAGIAAGTMGETGMIATDLLELIPRVLNPVLR